MATATKKRSLPPKPEARKAIPINAQYDEKAKALLKSAMIQRGVSIDELANRLNHMGIEISAGGLANKISRSGFGSYFLLQCMEALEVNLVALPR
jgi:Domain of unknown function (DUF6471)